MTILKIAGKHDVGLTFTYGKETYKIVKFKPRATKNPFVAQCVQTNEQFILPLTDNILIQIRKGKVTDIS